MDADEREILLQFIERQRDELVEFAGELIRTPSPNPPGDERAIVQLLQEHLATFGLEGEIVAQLPERPNLILRLTRGSGKRLILNGHTDTKPPGNLSEWQSNPYTPTFRDGKLYGLGACDMKGQIAALTYAFIALAETGLPNRGELLVVLSADEECGSRYGARYLVLERELRADAALVAEPSGIYKDWDQIGLLARGFSGFRIKVHGTQMHSSLSDLLPSINASTKMAHILSRMDRELEITYPPHPLCPQGITVNLGVMVSGGIYFGVYPGYAEFAVDVRTLPGMTKEGLRRDVEAFLGQLRTEDPSLQVEMEFEPGPLGWNEGTEISGDAPVVRASLRAAEHVLGYRPPRRAFPGGTDAGIFQSLGGIPTIPAFGPGLLRLAHNPNEYVDVESIVQAAKIYALTALHYLNDS